MGLLLGCSSTSVIRNFDLVYCYLSFLLTYAAVPLYVNNVLVPLYVNYVLVSPITFSFLITLRGTCGNMFSYFFFSSLCLSCGICYSSTSDLFC